MTTKAEREAALAKRVRSFLAHVQRTYGLTPTEYRALYFAQGGRCYVCRVAKGKAKFLGVDHDHLTGDVRGLVCTGSLNANTCNRLIAIYRPESLVRALEMLGVAVTTTEAIAPAQRVLRPLRAGETVLPYLYKPGTFNLADVKGVEL